MGKPIRLGRAAGELNVGISTLVDFLGSKGVKIDTNPNTKLEEEHYDLLRKEFAADQNMKEQSKFTTVKKEKRETISIRDKSHDDTSVIATEEEENEPISVEEIKRAVLESPDPEPEKESNDQQNIKVSVVGKIDLESINTKTRPVKKQEEAEENQPELNEEPRPEQVKEKKIEEDSTPAKEEVETIRVERKTLSGPTVLGRIELPVDKPKTPAQKTNEDSNEARRKRKRIKKIDVNKAADTNQNTANKGNFKKGAPRVDKPEISEQDIQKEIKETLARLSNQGGKSKASKNRRAKRDVVAQRRQEEMLQAELEEKVLKLTEFVTVSELASMMNVSPTQVISACMSLGIFASINQRLDAETIQIVADEFGYETQFVSADIQEAIPVQEDKEEELFGIVSKLEESPCQKYHRYHVVFDVKQAPLSMSSFVSLETKLEVVKNDKEETVVRVKFRLATQYWSESDVLLNMVL